LNTKLDLSEHEKRRLELRVEELESTNEIMKINLEQLVKESDESGMERKDVNRRVLELENELMKVTNANQELESFVAELEETHRIKIQNMHDLMNAKDQKLIYLKTKYEARKVRFATAMGSSALEELNSPDASPDTKKRRIDLENKFTLNMELVDEDNEERNELELRMPNSARMF
jgi:hypothetical protein